MALIPKHFLHILLVSITISQSAFSQWGLKEMISTRLGQTFSSSKENIRSMFSKKATIMKADFFGASRIEYEEMPFDYYGNANYTFQYAKDSLVAVKVEFTFLANDTAKFRRLYKTLINDLNTDQYKKLLKQYSDLNENKVMKYVKENCFKTTPKDDIKYKPINTAFLGQNFWAINGLYSYQKKFLRAYVQLAEFHTHGYGDGPILNYDGGEVDLVIELTSEYFQDLKNREEDLELRNYKIKNDLSEEIKMKLQNGVYSIPIKLNNTLSMDFVLDLGASDVSISPDIFLVLYKAGTIEESDFIGTETYRFADGSTAKSSVFNIKSIQIGGKEIKNIRASISNSLSSPLLLGQSAMKKFESYRIDNNQKVLIIE